MTMKEEKRQFVEAMLENFDEKIDTNVYKESVLKLLLKDTNGGKLYKYRCVNEYALDSLKNGTLYCKIQIKSGSVYTFLEMDLLATEPHNKEE